MRWLNYQHLYYFWNVARFGSVTEASQHLSLAQPTISAQLKSFEEVLGEKLFVRDGRNLKLTEVGQLANHYAQKIFSLGQEFLDVLDGHTYSAARALRVGIADVVPKSLAYKLIEPVFGSDTGTELFCFEDKTEILLAQLSIGEVDLVISDRQLPPNVKVRAFNHFVGESGVSFLGVRKFSSKYRKNFPISLDGAPVLLPTDDSAVKAELDRWFDKLGIVPHSVGLFQDRALMKLAARSGKGVMLIPSVVESEVRKEYGLDLIGRSTEVKEQLYLITIDRRLKNPLIAQMCSQGKKKIYSS